jgi:hypothetical protein
LFCPARHDFHPVHAGDKSVLVKLMGQLPDTWAKVVGEVLQPALHYEIEQVFKSDILRKLRPRFGTAPEACICAMHVAIGVTMGMYLFALIMIVLNAAAFGPTLVQWLGERVSLRK